MAFALQIRRLRAASVNPISDGEGENRGELFIGVRCLGENVSDKSVRKWVPRADREVLGMAETAKTVHRGSHRQGGRPLKKHLKGSASRTSSQDTVKDWVCHATGILGKKSCCLFISGGRCAQAYGYIFLKSKFLPTVSFRTFFI
ncbi:hypothetical protein TNIN_76291 [Trichonephila inaurata madagascariensis]|uniref:Uncharacterized protein n=1 Tax=Trichonephila inaurata madagascariensis TaxID=2747483 RepID=A0A8X7CRB1_9ARAC|nr:hypothetical protein TNIN_76291 [Trichonephila inaurata madagascariensis]